MKNLQELTEQLKKDRNPGHEIGTFLMGHSNSLEYLQGQLKMYLEAVERDIQAEREWFGTIMQALSESKKNRPNFEPKLCPSHPEDEGIEGAI